MSLYELLTASYRGREAKEFLRVPGGRSWRFDEFEDLVARIGAALVDRGVGPGDRLVAQVDKSPEALALYLGCVRIGAVYVPLNTAYTPREVATFVEDARPAAAVLGPANELTASDLPQLTLAADGEGSLVDLARRAQPGSAVPRADDDPAAMLYTSGTTGRSKGAVLTHGNLSSNALMLVDAWRFQPEDVLLHMLPIFHVHGLFVAVHCVMASGATMSFHPRFDVETVLADLPSCSVVMGVPTHYARLLSDEGLSAQVAAGVRLFTSGSAPLTPQVHALFEQRTGHTILERYGMTEAGMITSNPYDGPRVAGTVGYPLEGVEVRVVDGRGRPAASDVPGGVEVRGANVFAGYWGLPEKTAEAFTADGWLRTGDVGSLSADGRLTLAGRQSDMIISGGLNVYPREIEMALDGLAEIRESAVVGIPHPDLGEAVVAFVVAEDDWVDTCADPALLDLARFKHPKRYVPVEELPRNAMGKVQKAALRAQYSDLFASDTGI